jgi:ABC-type Fe3+/spermidine/putrescine transport system ATPase subunit
VGVTALYVTHDQAEAFAIADRAVVMNSGRVEQIGPPETIYCSPATPFVAHFLGFTNLAEGQIISRGRVASAWGEIETDTDLGQPGDQVSVLIRPEAARVIPPDTLQDNENGLRGELMSRSFRGGRYLVKVRPEKGPSLTLELSAVGSVPERPGDQITVLFDPAGIVLLPALH